MSFIIIGGAALVSGAVYLYRETIHEYLYPKEQLPPNIRRFKSVGGNIIEFSVNDGQYFRVIENEDFVMIPYQKLVSCSSHDEYKIDYHFKIGHHVTFYNHEHHLNILVKHDNVVLLDVLIDKEKEENVYKKIDNNSEELDYLETFFMKKELNITEETSSNHAERKSRIDL